MRRVLLKAIAAIVRARGDRRCSAAICICAGRCRRSTARSTVAGLSAPVDIIRDADAIPHIFAATKARRAVRPRLRARAGSAVADGVPAADRPRPAVRGLRRGDAAAGSLPAHGRLRPRRAERLGRRRRTGRSSRSTPTSPASTRSSRRITAAALPPEFTLLRFEPEPWSGVDVIVWVKMMAWDLSANYSFELLRHDLVRAVGAERMAQLMPPYPRRRLSASCRIGRGGDESAAAAPVRLARTGCVDGRADPTRLRPARPAAVLVRGARASLSQRRPGRPRLPARRRDGRRRSARTTGSSTAR